MNFSEEERFMLSEIERRRERREDPCESCDGSGRDSAAGIIGNRICSDCLGQGILLTGMEYEFMLFVVNSTSDDVLDAEYLH